MLTFVLLLLGNHHVTLTKQYYFIILPLFNLNIMHGFSIKTANILNFFISNYSKLYIIIRYIIVIIVYFLVTYTY